MTELSDTERQMAQLMVYGSEFPETIDGKTVPADWPLDVRQAALVLGFKLRRAREIADTPAFVGEINRLIRQRRASERARNLNVAVEIRDDPGEGLAADRTVRLKAIGMIEGTEGRGVVVNVNQTNNALTVTPGCVIRLSAKPLEPQLEGTPTRAPSRDGNSLEHHDSLTIDHMPAEPAIHPRTP